MQRCLELAILGAGNVAPNPMVGAVLVCDDKIIGEGWHQQYGSDHAEVICVNSVAAVNKKQVEKSILYVSLEPCVHFGKTPPCTDFIIKNKIPTVVIACRDSFFAVDGRGIEKLKHAGVEVITGVLEKEAQHLNKAFFLFQQKKRPYIILKWAETANKKIAGLDFERVAISNVCSNRLVHKWRSESAAIMVGTNTALHDNPSLTTRLFSGNSPVRIVIDKQLKLTSNFHLLNNEVKTIFFNNIKDAVENKTVYIKINFAGKVLQQIMEHLAAMKIQTLLVEGGSILLQSFIDEGLWDEARVIQNQALILQEGIDAPQLKECSIISKADIFTDSITYYQHTNS